LTTEQQKTDGFGGESKDDQTDTHRLGDLIDTIGGGTPKTDIDEYWEGENLWLTPSEVSDEKNIHISNTDRKLTDTGLSNTSAKILPPGSVLMTSRATVGVPVINTEPMATNQGFIGIKITEKDQLNNYYLLYWLKNKKSLIMNHASGSTYPEISQRSFNDLEIELPPIRKQIKTASVLRALDEKIEVNNRIIENLEGIAQTLFKSWFVDFERYNEFKQSDIGEIPVEFEVCTFGEVSDNYDSDRDPVSKTKRNEIEGDVPYYGATKILDFMDDYLFDGKFLLIAEDGSVKTDEGYPVIQFINKKFWASNHVHVVQGKGKVSTEFLRWAMSFVKIKPYITGSVQPKVNQTNLNSIELAVPPEEDLEEFTDLVKPIHNRIWQNKRENAYLERLRDTLLPKLMSGEIRVDDIKLDELEVDSEV
jgi:type I restriction enzyme S subunit